MKTLNKGWIATAAHGGRILTVVLLASGPLVAQTNSPLPNPPLPSEAAAPGIASLSPGMAEIVKLAQAGVSKDVLLSYIAGSPGAYHPTPDEIVYLNDLGVSDDVITSLMGKNPTGVGMPNLEQIPPQPAPSPDVPMTAPPSGVAPAPAPMPDATIASSLPPPDLGSPAPNGAIDPAIDMISDPSQAPPADYFYDSLAPYGTWVDVPDYGRCWQPAVVVANPLWRPYYDRGHWVYTDCGWYWNSGYTWGWAPFHYGRWCSDPRFGWVWAPGRVWSPAWVSWRYNSGFCGWAPLPPSAAYARGIGFMFHGGRVGVGFDFGIADSCYSFVYASHFADRNFHHFSVAPGQVGSLVRNSTVVNNYRVVNGKIFNEGIGRDHIVMAGHVDIPKVSLQDGSAAGLAAHSHQLHGTTLGVYRPELKSGAVAPSTAPARLSSPLRPAMSVASRSTATQASLAASGHTRYEVAVSKMAERQASTPAFSSPYTPANAAREERYSSASPANAGNRLLWQQPITEPGYSPQPQTQAPSLQHSGQSYDSRSFTTPARPLYQSQQPIYQSHAAQPVQQGTYTPRATYAPQNSYEPRASYAPQTSYGQHGGGSSYNNSYSSHASSPAPVTAHPSAPAQSGGGGGGGYKRP